MAARRKATKAKRGTPAKPPVSAKRTAKAGSRAGAKAAAKAGPRAKPVAKSRAIPAGRSRPAAAPKAAPPRSQSHAPSRRDEPLVHQGHWDHPDPMPGILARVAGARDRARLRQALVECRRSEFPGEDFDAAVPAELLREAERFFPADGDLFFDELEVARATDETGSVIGDTETVLYARRIDGMIHYRLDVNGEESGRVPARRDPLPDAELHALVAPDEDDRWGFEDDEIADEPEDEGWGGGEARAEADAADEVDRHLHEPGSHDEGDDLHHSLLRESTKPERPRRRRD